MTSRSLIAIGVSAFAAAGTSSQAAVTLAQWTFETSVPTTAGPHTAETAINSSTAVASINTGGTISAPGGNGGGVSFSSNNWNTGEYFQFATEITGYSGITLTLDVYGSNTGPANFEFQYSTDGATFTPSGVTYTVANSWATKTLDLSAVDFGVATTLYVRVVNTTTTSINGGTVAAGGTSRVDNVAFVSVPEPASGLLGAIGLLTLVRRRR